MNTRMSLIPYMGGYDQDFSDNGNVRWLPYLMYFHPSNYRSPLVNTDHYGFRYAEINNIRFSVSDHNNMPCAKLIVGSSTVFGIGASSDQWTLASCLSKHDKSNVPWLNFSGRSFNATQELLLMSLYQHLLPPIEEIVIFSGFNDLGLARMPAEKRLDQGAFFNCNQFFDRMTIQESARSLFSMRGKQSHNNKMQHADLTIAEQIDFAAQLILKHLHIWKIFANAMQAKLTYILQPLSGWVRQQGCQEEERLFAELDQIGKFSDVYGDILNPTVCNEYAAQLEKGAQNLGVNFINFSPLLSQSTSIDQWLFVDRIHFTDHGHDVVAKKILELI